MVQKDGRISFSGAKLLISGKMVLVLRKVTNLDAHGIVLSDSSALFHQLNGNTLDEHCDRKYAGLVTV